MWFLKQRIYLDHASATPVLKEAAAAVHEAQALFGNPGAIHGEAVAAKALLQSARERIALELACKAREVVFTSGLTESNNLAIIGFARKMLMSGRELKGTHWILSSIEHSSVLEPFAEIERLGGEVTHIDPDEKGIVSAEKVAHALRPNTIFVSICWGNNEIGTVQPLREISQKIRAYEVEKKTTIIFHTDAGQAPLYEFPQVHSLGVDMMSLGSGKLYGPRGIGALYLSNRVELAPILLGGGQERALRSGTEEPALAAGFATAFEIIATEREVEAKRLKKIRDDFAKELLQKIPDAIINGDLRNALPHMLNISLPHINAEYTVLSLDREGIALSTKSACNEGESASHVVASLGGPQWRATNTLRFSLGRATTDAEVAKVVDVLVSVIKSS
jgi:cysteine desulfurase